MRRLIVLSIALWVTGCGSSRVPTSPTSPGEPAAGGTRPPANFEVTFTADPACTDLPIDARSRKFGLVFGGPGATLTGATFVPSGNPYPAWNVLYTNLSDASADLWFQDPPIWEALSNESYLVIFGDAHGPIGPDTSTMRFWGRFEYCAEREPDTYPECEVPEIKCQSGNHTLTLRRK